MKDYLDALLKRHNIILIYTNNKKVILSTGVNKGKPVIRAQKMFMNCPEYLAEAIVDYYMGFQEANAFKVIEKQVMDFYSVHDFTIMPPQKMFLELRAQMPINTDHTVISKSAEDHDKRELKVLKIISKDMRGNTAHIMLDQTIKAEESEVYELDITVDDL